ncbi:hypothetical protein SAMN05660649_02824 [Desulfotomaculum arcticum]|uniref:Uncharacterized protein n=1 Tax=Desulfotruncus arcticus DSM 17038 TaxID=1121424 RepID=A0A1I2V312_9FIRM|nr:hypothetical protein [Desulfotruncus arcticus]SFG82647.1 hypothetical protein SAMN05660649_02824 [Desulfotomaculum arcticum] [Desulfotruncus arcticus DSM 17038]
MSNSSLTFLPWLRSGIGTLTKPADKLPNEKRRCTSLQVDTLCNGSVRDTHVQRVVLKGPGEVLGFNPQMIARTEPFAGENQFLPNYFPFVEFTDPDFPWRYSLDDSIADNSTGTGRNSRVKIRPWIALIVLKRGAGEFEEPKDGEITLPVIKAKLSALPDLEQAWAWAHVQLSGDIEAGENDFMAYENKVGEFIDQYPELTCSRVMCPRRLDECTLYSAFIVPVFKMGCEAALGNSISNIDAPAWNKTTAGADEVVELPYYYRWDFQTAEKGDFEALIDALEIGAVPPGTGTNPADGRDPGFLMDEHGNKVTFVNGLFYTEGALVPPDYDAHRLTYPNVEFADKVIAVMNETLHDYTVIDADAAKDPLVSLPVYGRYYQGVRQLVKPGDDGTWNSCRDWLSELNLDRSYRVAASTGTSVVKENQEEFVRECWETTGEIGEANEVLRFCSAATHIAESLKTRHADPLGNARFTLISQPFHSHYIHKNHRGEKSFRARFTESGLPPGCVSYAFRPIINRRVGIKNVKDEDFFRPWSKDPNGPVKPRTPDNDKTIARSIADSFLLTGKELNAEDIQAYYNELEEWVGPGIFPLQPETIRTEPIDIGITGEQPGGDSLRGRFDIEGSHLERLNSIISIPGETIVNLNPIIKTPKIDWPMYKYLLKRSIDALVPNLGQLKKSTVVLMQQNSAYIEAYMAGLNHEMIKELVWREFPVDRKGTIFNYFWDPTEFINPPYDIQNIRDWDGGLGTHGRRDFAKDNAVLVIKADLFRRFPQTILFSLKVTKGYTQWDTIFSQINSGHAMSDDFEVIQPVLKADLGDDTIFVFFPFSPDSIINNPRFDYYFVLMEPSSLPRFGLDESSPSPVPLEDWDCFSWDHVVKDSSGWVDFTSLNSSVTQPPGPHWGNDSAAAAWTTCQKPVRIIIDAEAFVRDPQNPIP